jgi:hypothetical protein
LLATHLLPSKLCAKHTKQKNKKKKAMGTKKELENIIFNANWNSQFRDVVQMEIATKSFNLAIELAYQKILDNSFLSTKELHAAAIDKLKIK